MSKRRCKYFRHTVVGAVSSTVLFAAAVCLHADNVADLRNWHSEGLPAVAVWAVDGHTIGWSIAQIKAGHRLLPSIRLPMIDADAQNASNPRLVKSKLDDSGADLAWLDAQGLPICLRTNNICDTFTRPARWRLPKVAESIPHSPLIWKMLPDGKLDDAPVCDSLAPVELWRGEGQRWAQTLYMQRLQRLVRQPAFVMLVENNEGSYETGKPYGSSRTYDDLRSMSLRLADFARANPDYDFGALSLDVIARERTQYAALYAGFDGAFTDGWRGKLLTAAYRGLERGTPGLGGYAVDRFGTWNPSASMYEAASPPIYFQNKFVDLTSAQLTEVMNYIPDWEAKRKSNPRAWREVSIHLDDDAVTAAKTAGRHEAITPELWGGFVTTLAWLFHEPGVPVMFRHWDGAATKPTARRGAATVGDYELAELSAVDRICDTPMLRAYWTRGQTVVSPGPVPWAARQRKDNLGPYPRPDDPDKRRRWLNVSCNTPVEQMQWARDGKNYVIPAGAGKFEPATIKVWAVATELDARWLLWVFTPCGDVGTVTVTIPGAGDVQIDMGQVPGGDYWLVEPAGARATKLERN